MGFFNPQAGENKVSGAIFDYMVLYFMQKHYGLPIIGSLQEEDSSLEQFLLKPLDEQLDAVRPQFEEYINRFQRSAISILFTNLVLFYGCEFDYSTCVQITSREVVRKENGGFRTIKILGQPRKSLLLRSLFSDPIDPLSINLFSMNPEKAVHLNNLLFVGAWDILQPRDSYGIAQTIGVYSVLG